MLNLGISLMVQYLGVCLPMSGHRFDPWSRKIPRATGQLNPRCTTTAASTPEPTLSIQSSQHTEKPGHCGGRDPAQPEIKEKENSQKKATLNLGGILNDVRHIYHEGRNQGNIWPELGGSLILNHPHDGVTRASWMKSRCLISSPATNSNLASIHGHTQSARRKKTANQEYSIQKSCLSEMKEK